MAEMHKQKFMHKKKKHFFSPQITKSSKFRLLL